MCDFFTPVYLHRPGTPSALSARPKTGTKPLAPPPEFAGPERMSKRHVQGHSVCLSDWVNHDTQPVGIRRTSHESRPVSTEFSSCPRPDRTSRPCPFLTPFSGKESGRPRKGGRTTTDSYPWSGRKEGVAGRSGIPCGKGFSGRNFVMIDSISGDFMNN